MTWSKPIPLGLFQGLPAVSGDSPKADGSEPEEVLRDEPELPGSANKTPLALSVRRDGSIRLRGGKSKTPSLAISAFWRNFLAERCWKTCLKLTNNAKMQSKAMPMPRSHDVSWYAVDCWFIFGLMTLKGSFRRDSPGTAKVRIAQSLL